MEELTRNFDMYVLSLFLLQMSSVSPVGTIAYIIDEEALLVRVNNGWQYIAVSCAVLFLPVP